MLFEDNRIVWSGEFIFALLWLVLVLSLGAISLLYVLIRRGAASRVSGLFFLVPPCTALIAWPLFGETLGPVSLVGLALTVVGVAMATRGSCDADHASCASMVCDPSRLTARSRVVVTPGRRT